MPYTAREALTVALYNSGVEPLHLAFDKADTVLDGLRQMGWTMKDEYEGADFQDVATAQQFLSKTALRVVPDL